MAIDPSPPTPVNTGIMARATLRTWIKARIAEPDTVSAAEVAQEALAMIQQRPDLLAAFVQECILPAVHRQVLDVVARTRGTVHEVQVLGDTLVRRPRPATGIFTPSFTHWLEFTGVSHRRLVAMTAPELRAAAAYRRAATSKSLVVATLLDSLADELQGNETVGERFGVEDLERRYQEVMAHVA